MKPVNPGRELAYVTFRSTLAALLGREGVTEVQFRDEWFDRLSDQPQLTVNGWYDPPPEGLAVLFGQDDADVPFGFASLRAPAFWPSARIMNWRRGLMYAYCSPVDITTGRPADFGITLYFGRDRAVRHHFSAALSVTHEVMDGITPRTMARPLFRHSEQLFQEVRMRSNVASITDSVPVDLGHSLPLLSLDEVDDKRQLSDAAKGKIRTGRLFISESADWHLADAGQVTIEPSLVSLENPRLPQVSPHYVVAISEEDITICDECDLLYSELGLLR